MTRLQSRYTAQELAASSVASSIAEEAISAIRTVFAFGGQAKERSRYSRSLQPACSAGCKRNIVTALGSSVNWAVLYGSFALGVWYGVKLILTEPEVYSIGVVVIILWVITGIGYSISYAAPYWEAFNVARTAAAGIYRIIDRQSGIDSSSTAGSRLANYKADIELRDVHFSYPTRPEVSVLDGVNLKIEEGETVALVGASGCGKSTIIQLIQRFYDPSSGSVLLGGVNLAELNPGWLRQQIGVVGQEPILFDASIEANIRLGSGAEMDSVTAEEIERAAKEANAHDFITGLPEGYQTYVGDRGTQLSGGQKQRIAIARALIGRPRILLLDEATSALDLTSEQIVQAALDRARQGRTTIIVAHRLSTIINADRIIVLDGGKVLEMGTHDQLMTKQSAYFSLVKAQEVTDNSTNESTKEKIDNKRSSLQPRNSSAGSFGSSAGGVLEEQNPKTENEKALKSAFPYGRIFQLILFDKISFAVALLSAAIYGLGTPAYGLIFGAFVDEFTVEQTGEELLSATLKYSMLFVALAVTMFATNTLQISLFGIVGERLTLRLRTKAFSAILKQEVAWFDEPVNSAGALCSRLANDAANVQGATGLRIAMMAQAVSTLIACILVGFLYNWKLALGGLILMPIIAIAAVISSKLYSGQAIQDGQTAELSGKVVIEVMNAIRTVVSLHREEYFFEKFVGTLEEHFRATKKRIFCKAFTIGVSLGAPFFSYAVAFLLGGYLISVRQLHSGDFFRVVESMVFGAMVVGNTAVLSSDFAKAQIAAISIFKLIDRKPIKRVPENTEMDCVQVENEKRSKGNISFRGLNFSYPSRPETSILNGLSFSAAPGETVALVGASGCGKSTTIQLLEQFYEYSGQINLDGQDITQLDVDWVRRQMALVQQEPILFSYSIAENIAYGDNARAVPLEEIVRAAQMANVHEFVAQLPQGYETPVGGKGAQLSGGQKQRIAIARSLVRDPPILLLDEATSALDTASEKVVQEAIDQAAKGRTCLVIAHRLKTIVNADKIVVFEGGRNVEEGTHEELLERRGHYWRLYNRALAT